MVTQSESRLKINRQESGGALGDVGTDLPLLVAVISASGLDSAGVLIAFGLLQILTAVTYRMPMPVQPPKAMALSRSYRSFPYLYVGVILFVEGLSLLLLVRDPAHEKRSFFIALLAGMMVVAMPYGFAVALVAGTTIYYAPLPFKVFTGEK